MTFNPVLGKNNSTDTCLSFLNDKILKDLHDGLVTGMILTKII